MWSGIPISWRIFQFVVIHTVKGFSIVNKAEVNVLLEFFCFFYDPMDLGNVISSSSTFSKSSLYILMFLVHLLLKLSLKDFERYFACIWNGYNCAVVWTYFDISLLWDWNENGPFPVLWPLLSFPNLLAYWVQHFHSIIFWTWNSSAGIPSPPLALFIVMLPKAHLTQQSRVSGSRWVNTPLWLSRSLRVFLYGSPVYFCHLFLIVSVSVRSLPFLSFIKPIFVWNVPLVSPILLKRSLVFPFL